MKMRIKKYFLPCFLPVIAILCFVFLSNAFAAMEKVDEAVLAQTNASVTGGPVNGQIAGAENGGVNPETWQASETLNRDAVIFPSFGKTDVTSVDMNVNGQTTFQFYFGGSTSNVTGGITSVKPLH
jgi:hypothetical protein